MRFLPTILRFFLHLAKAYTVYEWYLKNQIEQNRMPRHVGIIMDGNRRWSRERALDTTFGYSIGADRVEQLLDWCFVELNIQSVTLYVLSNENLQRTREELEKLFDVIEERLCRLYYENKLDELEVRVKAIGQIGLLPASIRQIIQTLEHKTSKYDKHYLNIAIAYGGRIEMIECIRKITEKAFNGQLRPSDINERLIEEHLYTCHLPNPDADLIIRTSGEERLSGFLIWQSAYSELVFLDSMWPDFRKIDFLRAIRSYQTRQRRFGK
ncbi:MAG: polyprenyl diphosphate synthase [Nitrososphaerales archaeon]